MHSDFVSSVNDKNLQNLNANAPTTTMTSTIVHATSALPLPLPLPSVQSSIIINPITSVITLGDRSNHLLDLNATTNYQNQNLVYGNNAIATNDGRSIINSQQCKMDDDDDGGGNNDISCIVSNDLSKKNLNNLELCRTAALTNNIIVESTNQELCLDERNLNQKNINIMEQQQSNVDLCCSTNAIVTTSTGMTLQSRELNMSQNLHLYTLQSFRNDIQKQQTTNTSQQTIVSSNLNNNNNNININNNNNNNNNSNNNNNNNNNNKSNLNHQHHHHHHHHHHQQQHQHHHQHHPNHQHGVVNDNNCNNDLQHNHSNEFLNATSCVTTKINNLTNNEPPLGRLVNYDGRRDTVNLHCDNNNDNNKSGNISASTSTTPSTSTSTSTSQYSLVIQTEIVNDSSNDLHNLDISADADADSPSSSVGSFDLDDKCNDRHTDGYQDNTSSHSHQSGGGGNLSGSCGNSAGNSSSGGVISGNANSAYISIIPPPIGTTATTNNSGESIDFKHLFEELCPVCGDKVSGYHYGLLTCESCKGFFKRTVQNKKVYTCVAERSCHIDKTQRKRCPYCRFQKCLEVGMKLEAVRADRMRGGRNKFGPMYKRDRARKLQMMRQRQLALQAIRTSMGSSDMKSGQISPTGYQPTYTSMNIKQEIQIPQVSSLTQSPDSSPSPIAIALGQVNATAAVGVNSINGNNGAGSTNTATAVSVSGISGTNNCENDSGSGTLQHSIESKLCFDTGTNPSSTVDSVSNVEPLRVSPMIREFVQSIDDREWQTQLYALLQKQSYNQVEVDLFELMCKVLDQNLFSQVDWARNTVFFKDLKVDDQMKLLQHSWSDMLVLDHLHQRIHNGLPDETQLNNGQLFNLLGLGLLGVPQLADYFNELQNKLQELKFDMGDYVCMKFLILLNPNVRGVVNKKTVLEGHENVQAALLDYTLTCYPSVTDKFSRLLNILPDIHAMAARGEEHLYHKHCAGSAPTQTLLMEMLHAKRKV